MTIAQGLQSAPATLAEEQKRAQKTTWSASASGWDRWFDWYVAQFQPVFDWCCDAIHVAPGMRVLDIACGTGQPALTLAQRVGSEGRVDAVDFSPEMVAAAARRARSLGVSIELHQMDAEALTFPDGTFDAVTFVCGLMFCPEPARAASEIRRVLKPGGRFAIVVWDEPAKNQFASVVGRAAGEVFRAPPPPPNAPQAFRFQRSDLETLLHSAGLRDIAIESRAMFFDYVSVQEYLEITTDLAGALKAKLETLAPTDLERFTALVHANAAPYLSQGKLRLPATPLCASGRT
jgi:SAM-dependent methyltransferase